MVLPGRNSVKGDCGGVLLKDGMHKVVYFRVAELGAVVVGNGMRGEEPGGFRIILKPASGRKREA